MASRIPTEIAGLIVEDLYEQDPEAARASLKSCCLIGKIFVSPCQRRLFQEIVLQPAKFAKSTSELIEGPDHTLRFAKLLQDRPHLADYVRQLTYRFANEGTLTKSVEDALMRFHHITDLELQVEDKLQRGFTDFFGWSLSGTHFEQSQHAHAVLSLVRQPQLRKLVLRSLELPIDTLERCVELQIVELHDSTCFHMDELKEFAFLHPSWAKGDGDDEDEDEDEEIEEDDIFPEPIYIKELKLHGLDTFLLLEEFFTNANFDRLEKRMAVKFCQLRALEVPVSENRLTATSIPQQSIDVCQVLLSRTERLEELHLYSVRPVSDGTGPISNRLECPLASLHPASFSTLRRLSYSISIFDQFGAPHILDPYHGLLRGDGHALKQLVALEDLTIAIWISREEMLHFNIPCFGDGWGALYNTLKRSQASTYPCEKLKSLTVTIGASLLTEDQDPKVLLMMFKDQVLRRHFGEVKKLAKARGIVLKLDTPVRIKEYPIVQLD